MQNLVEKTLGGRSGSIVVLKASTNEIITSASNNADENSLYPAGSLSYLPVLSALLEDKNFEREKIVNCNGKAEINGIKVTCNKIDGHGELNLKEAFANTCDVYFAKAMQNCDSKKLLESERKFNFEITDDTWLSKPYQAVQTSPIKMAQMMSTLCKDKSPSATELKEFLRYRITDGSLKTPLKNNSVKIAGTIATSDYDDPSVSESQRNRWNSAVAVVYNVAEDETFFWGMGIHIIYAPWAPKKSSGFLGIRELEGLKDGSKAFDIVKKADPEGYKNLKKNYPALYFAATYGQTYNVGKYKDGWYIPAYKETYQLDPFCYDHDRWEKLKKVMKALRIFAPDCSDDDWWCSDSKCRENDYLGLLTDNKSGYRFSDVPGGIEIYQNKCTSTCIDGDTNYSNSEVKSVRVVRKFY